MPAGEAEDDPFPWHLGVYDAHCHPTDTMCSLKSLEDMQARVLTVMATRAEDQDLVLAAADKHGVKSSNPNDWTQEERIVPCFGWHPWFSHQMYIAHDTGEPTSHPPSPLTGEAKISHYQSVLQPSRPHPSPEDRQTFLSLPDPTPFSTFLAQTRKHLLRHPYALIGEIGLDRCFRIPEPWPADRSLRHPDRTPGGRDRRPLTPFRCAPHHQQDILQRQLQLAGEMGRGVSVHGVQAHGMLLATLRHSWAGHEKPVPSRRAQRRQQDATSDEHGAVASSCPHNHSNPNPVLPPPPPPPPYPPRICLHSYSGSASNFKQYLHPAIPARIFASFSTAVNLPHRLDPATPPSLEEVVRAVPDHALLVESDLDRAGRDMDSRLEDMVRRLCRIKGWGVEEGVQRLGENWRAFVFGEGEGEGEGEG